MADITAINYEELAQIVQAFGAQSEGIVQVQQRIKQAFDPLFSGDWQGEGGDAFFNEMNALVFPAIDKLSQALLHAQEASQHALDTMQTAEHDAQGLFQADGAAGGGNGSASAAGAAAGAGAGAGAAAGAGFMGSAGGAGASAGVKAGSGGGTSGGVKASSGGGTSAGGGGTSAGGGGGGGGGGGAGSAAGSAGAAQGGGATNADIAPAKPATNTGPHDGIGSLSARYETGGRGAGTVSSGKGDPGGPSYGSYQMTSQTNFKATGGRVAEFLRSPDGSQYASQFQGLKPGSAAFTAKWKQLATSDPKGFQQAQHAFIQRTHYDVQTGVISKATGLNVNSRSAALQDVVWSTSVQNGPSTSVVTNALRGRDVSKMSDAQVINAIYDERGRIRSDGKLAYFTRVSPAVRQGVINRFRSERADALRMLNGRS